MVNSSTPLLLLGLSILFAPPASAFPSDEKIIEMSNSVVKVHVNDRDGNYGIGSGFVVRENHVVTSCHVIAGAHSVRVAKEGVRYKPIAFKADWRHDLCILKFDDLPLKPLPLGDGAGLEYEQEVFALGFPQNSPRSQPSFGFIKALYPLDDSSIIRASAGFRLGASGGPLLDDDGEVIGITTFKDPGRFNNFYYSLPIKWVKELLLQSDISDLRQTERPFWDVPEEQRPYFMRVVPPLKAEIWNDLETLAKNWSVQEPLDAEPWYYLGLAEYHLHNVEAAIDHLQKAITLNHSHTSAYLQLGLIAAEQGDKAEAQRISLILGKLDTEASDLLNQAVRP